MNDRSTVTPAIGGPPLLSIVAPVYLSDAIVPL